MPTTDLGADLLLNYSLGIALAACPPLWPAPRIRTARAGAEYGDPLQAWDLLAIEDGWNHAHDCLGRRLPWLKVRGIEIDEREIVKCAEELIGGCWVRGGVGDEVVGVGARIVHTPVLLLLLGRL
jgi:hypothetical protein